MRTTPLPFTSSCNCVTASPSRTSRDRLPVFLSCNCKGTAVGRGSLPVVRLPQFLAKRLAELVGHQRHGLGFGLQRLKRGRVCCFREIRLSCRLIALDHECRQLQFR